MSKSKCIEPAKQLHEFLNKIPDQLGKVTGFVQRRSKMTSAVFIQTLLLGWLHHPEASLQELCHWSRELGVMISPQGLDKRINAHAVELLKALFGQTVHHFQERHPLPASLLNQFKAIHILDSSFIVLPDHMKDDFKGTGGDGPAAMAKIQLSFDYLSGRFNAIELGSAHIPDQKSQLHLQYATAGSLHLFDLGYFKLDVFRELTDRDAYFISRFNTQCALYTAPTDKTAIDLPAYLQQLPDDCHETILYMGAKERLPVRILFQKLPPQVVEERRRKAKRTAQRTLKQRTQRHLDLLAWSIFITNVPPEMLTFEQVLLLYRVRWQIELLFKLWKSYAQVTAFGCWRSERILCQLYAKMILMVLFQWMINPQRVVQSYEMSYPKAFRLLQLYHVFPLLQCIRQGFRNFNSFLNAFLRDLAQYARKDRRQKQPSTYNLIWAASLTRLG